MSDPRAWKRQAHTLFEHESEHYAGEREQEFGFQAQLEIVLRMLAGANGRVLDIGCAAGSEITALRASNFEVVGVEFSAAMLTYAHVRFAADPHVHLCQGDAEFLPFRSASVDHVTCLGVLEYVPDYRPTLAEVSRVLRPGGLAVFSIPSRINPFYAANRITDRTLGPPWRMLKRLAGKLPAPASEQTPKHSRNLCVPWRFQRLLREFDLAPEQTAFSNFCIYPLDRISPALHHRAAMSLERFSSSPPIGWMASQYLISARRK